MSSGWGDDGFGVDPFGVSGDVFGRELGDVDPFGGHDSFDGDAEWNEFNNDDGVVGRQERLSLDPSAGRSASRSDSPKKKKGKKPESSSRSSKGAASSRKLMSSGTSSSAKAPKSPTKPSSRGRGREEEDVKRGSRSRSASRAGRRSRSRSSSAGPGGKEASFSTGKFRGTKAAHRSRHSTQKSGDASAVDVFADSSDGPFGFGTTASDDGFGDFAAFSADSHDDGFGNFADLGDTSTPTSGLSPAGRQKRSPRPRGSGTTRHASVDEDEFPAKERQSFRRGSLGSGSGGNLGGSVHTSTSNGGTSAGRYRRPRTRNVVSRIRPSEQQARMHESNERRSAIKDSLFGALGEEEEASGDVSLANFLGDDKKKESSHRRASDSHSIHSAPAAIRPPRNSRRSTRNLFDDHHSAGSEPHMHGKSRRYQRKMGTSSGAAPVAKETPTKKNETLKLDLAALAEQGYLEYQDGKMRLVIDVDPEA